MSTKVVLAMKSFEKKVIFIFRSEFQPELSVHPTGSNGFIEVKSKFGEVSPFKTNFNVKMLSFVKCEVNQFDFKRSHVNC